MSHHCATLQSAFDKTASALDFAYALAERIYWLDDNYVQPFYAWAAPRLRDVAISALYWALVTLIDITLWLLDTTRQFFARDAQAIALVAFAYAHEPLSHFLALPPSPVALALPSMAHAPFPSPVVQWVSVPEALNDMAPVLALCPTVVPLPLTQFLNPNDSIQHWLTSALPLVLAPFFAQALAVPVSPVLAPVVPSVTEAAPVVKKTRKPKSTKEKAQDETPRKRSPKTATATAQ
jgi:hypothetical protein